MGCVSGVVDLSRFFKHPIFQFFKPAFKYQLCLSTPECKCADDCTAGTCLKATGKLCVKFEVAISVSMLLEFFELTGGEVVRAFNALVSFLEWLAENTLSGGSPCPVISKSVTGEVSVAGCLVGILCEGSVWGKTQWACPNYDPEYTVGGESIKCLPSACGWLSLEFCAGLSYKECW